MRRRQKIPTTSGLINISIFIIISLDTQPAYCQSHSQNFGNYSFPSTCRAATLPPYHDSIQLYCTVIFLPPDANYAAIQTKYTRELTFRCTDPSRTSDLGNAAISHLTELQRLNLYFCSLSRLSSSSFVGLTSLRHLNIVGSFRTRLGIIEPRALSYLTHLESVNLSANDLISLPYQFFCSLRNLRIVELDVNSLTHMNSTGLQCYNIREGPLRNLTTLNLRNNSITTLGEPLCGYIPNVINLTMSDNRLEELGRDSLHNLTQLNALDLSHNELKALGQVHLRDLANLEHLFLDNNELSQIDSHLFVANQRLKSLGLSRNRLTSKSVSAALIQNMRFLKELDISRNLIASLNPYIFRILTNLVTLKLNHNKLTDIPDQTFQNTNKLQTLYLSNNLLTNITNNTFVGLKSLQTLELGDNRLKSINTHAFASLVNLKILNISFNNLSEAPKSLLFLSELQLLIMYKNPIVHIKEDTWRGLQSLVALKMTGTLVTYIPKAVLSDSPNLYVLNLGENNINNIEYQAFDDARALQYVNLTRNKISDIQFIFNNLQFLRLLDLSRNVLTFLSFSLFPSSLEILDVSHNMISSLSPATFKHLHRLIKVDLRYNKLVEIAQSALFKSRHTPLVPQIFLRGNTLECTCNMKYLLSLRKSYDPAGLYPRVPDLDFVLCRKVLGQRFQFILHLTKDDFFCEYTNNEPLIACPAGCDCCYVKGTCPCAYLYQCPRPCSCFHNGDRNMNIADCRSRNLTQIPHIPWPQTLVLLDGNNISNVSWSYELISPEVTTLDLQNSHVTHIFPETFKRLYKLKHLNLSHNLLKMLDCWTFWNVTSLKTLSLNDNRINYIENGTFYHLRNLDRLYLHNNELVALCFDCLSSRLTLTTLTLAGNPWSCNCSIAPGFQEWLVTQGKLVDDINNVTCLNTVFNATDVLQSLPLPDGQNPILDIQFGFCKNASIQIRTVSHMNSQHAVALVVLTLLFAVITSVSILVYYFREFIQIWLYTRFGWRIHRKKEDAERQFDAFISYSSKDEPNVLEQLVFRLENGQPKYKLCLHYRDWLVGAYISDAIIDSVESSKRTIIVLSQNFVDSEWCQYEFKTAHQQLLEEKRNRLIMILLEDDPPKRMDKDLQLYIKTNTYLKWHDPWFWERLYFAMPDAAKCETDNSETKEKLNDAYITSRV